GDHGGRAFVVEGRAGRLDHADLRLDAAAAGLVGVARVGVAGRAGAARAVRGAVHAGDLGAVVRDRGGDEREPVRRQRLHRQTVPAPVGDGRDVRAGAAD